MAAQGLSEVAPCRFPPPSPRAREQSEQRESPPINCVVGITVFALRFFYSRTLLGEHLARLVAFRNDEISK